MRTSFTLTSRFGAGHITDLAVGSNRLHIHDFKVAITVTDADHSSSEDIAAAFFQITESLEGRKLEDMMPGASTDPIGIAAWFMEQLALNYPRLVRVEVWESDELSMAVERDAT